MASNMAYIPALARIPPRYADRPISNSLLLEIAGDLSFQASYGFPVDEGVAWLREQGELRTRTGRERGSRRPSRLNPYPLTVTKGDRMCSFPSKRGSA
jgi:hypothetical protein